MAKNNASSMLNVIKNWKTYVYHAKNVLTEKKRLI